MRAVAPTLWGTGGTCPHFYTWLGKGAPWVEEQQNKKLTKLYWPPWKRSPKRLIVLVEPKIGGRARQNFFRPFALERCPRFCPRPVHPHFKIRSGATAKVARKSRTPDSSNAILFYTEINCCCYWNSGIVTRLWPKFHLARLVLDSTRFDTFDCVERVETSVSSESSRAVPTWRTTNKL